MSAIKKIGLILCLSFTLLSYSHGHFQLNANIRVAHFEHDGSGVRLYLRLPTPYILAQLLGAEQSDGTIKPAPYTTNRLIDGEPMHYFDFNALASDPIKLGTLVKQGHAVTVDKTQLNGEVEAVRVHTISKQPPFSTLDEARRIFDSPNTDYPSGEIFVGDTVTDVLIFYPSSDTLFEYQFSSSLDPKLENQDETANIILDYFPGSTQIYRATGLLKNPIEIKHSAISAGLTFVKEGIRHILEGYDHVLFVLCLAIGAITLSNLFWRITGFTIGHTITLSAGFFGWAPKGAWFIPIIELGIALSIIYVAIIALYRRETQSAFGVTAAIGLLHGFGFSFVLHEILQVSSPNIWQSLLAFNIGVEIGQILLVLLVWPALYLLSRSKPKLERAVRWIIAIPCMAVASLWVGERVINLWQVV